MLHSPTPSSVRIAASSNGLGKNALAAWLSWWSRKTQRRRAASAAVPRGSSRRMNSFFFSQTGMAMLKLREARRRVGEVGLEQPLELGQRLVVERDVVEVAPASARPPRRQ